jgi:MFS family permease
VPFGTLRFLAQKDMLLALPALTSLGFVGTAVAFHQVLIATSKGWPLALFASGFALLAAMSVVSTLIAGWLVDRFGARRPALIFLFPMAIGCFALALSDAPAAIFVYMALSGVSAGAFSPVTTSLLAEGYGVERLGAIRATAASAVVVSTAASPVLIGVLADLGVPVAVLVFSLGIYTLVAAVMLFRSGLTRRGRTEAVTA